MSICPPDAHAICPKELVSQRKRPVSGRWSLALAAFHAMVVLGSPGSDSAIVEVIDGDLREIPREEALGAAAARRTRAAIQKLECWKDDRGWAFAAIGAIADANEAKELIRLLGERETVEELRPIMGALVRLSPLPRVLRPFGPRCESGDCSLGWSAPGRRHRQRQLARIPDPRVR